MVIVIAAMETAAAAAFVSSMAIGAYVAVPVVVAAKNNHVRLRWADIHGTAVGPRVSYAAS
jgi:hypothetical protein